MAMEIEKLKAIVGRELKYKELCQELGMESRSGNSKISQLNQLKIYCRLEVLRSPTRYVVKEVYGAELAFLGLDTVHGNNKYQLLFEAALYQEFIRKDGESLYLSDMDFLKLFNEINENFAYTCSLKNMIKLGEEYIFMTPMGQTVYKILRQWTRRRLEIMEKRKVILTRDGFRLYKKVRVDQGKEITMIKNVPMESEEEKICQEIYNEACEEIMPEDWNTYEKGRYWVSEQRWIEFERKIRELVAKRFEGRYVDMKCIKIISPPTLSWLNEKVEKLKEQINRFEIDKINIEAQKKVMETKQLDQHTNEERKKFIEINMKKEPPVLFKEALREL